MLGPKGDAMTYRVVQWTTGNVGRQSVQAIVAHPTSSWSAATPGRPTRPAATSASCAGSRRPASSATNDVDALLGLKPDCVVYNPMWPDVDELVRILESGVNVVSTAAFITGHSLGDGRGRIVEACERGGSSIFGTASTRASPTCIAIVRRAAATASTRSPSPRPPTSPATTRRHRAAGRLRPPHRRPGPAGHDHHGTAVFEDAVAVGDALGVELDEVVCEAEYAPTTEDLDLARGPSTGRLRGRGRRQLARQGRRPHIVELQVRWRKGQSLEPDWEMDTGYRSRSTAGRRSDQVDILPPPDFEARRSVTSWCSG